MLAQQLKELVKDGLVTRREEISNESKAVYYSLTTTGESLMPIIEEMFTWGAKRLEKLALKSNFKLG